MRWYRPQRGGYEEAMALKCRVSSLSDLAHCLGTTPDKVTVKRYSDGLDNIDQRNGWDTHIVSVSGDAVGWLSGPISPVL